MDDQEYKERNIYIRVLMYEDDKIDIPDIAMRDLNCSFIAPSELVQRFYDIGTDSCKSDQEVADYYIAAMKSSGVSVRSYEIVQIPPSLTEK